MKKKLENFIFRLRTTKLGIILIAIVIGTITLATIWNFNVNISEDQFRVTGIFGQTVKFEEVEDITLLEESIQDIGIVTSERYLGTSGTRGFNVLALHRGNFMRRYIYAQVNQASTIQITRISGDPIYLNLGSSNRTRELYQNLLEAWR